MFHVYTIISQFIQLPLNKLLNVSITISISYFFHYYRRKIRNTQFLVEFDAKCRKRSASFHPSFPTGTFDSSQKYYPRRGSLLETVGKERNSLENSVAEFESPRRSLSRMDIEVAFNTLVTGRKMAFRMSRFVRVSRVIDGPALLPWRILNGGRPTADIKGLLGLRIVNEVVKMWTGNRSAAAIHRGRSTSM